jgi:outer membrane cobalamin receptor
VSLRPRAAVVWGAALAAPWLWGAGECGSVDAAREAGPERAEQVVITGHLEEDLPIDLEHYGARVDVVSAEQIGNGGYLDVAGALQSLVPGLYISPKNGPFDYADISLQGSRTADVLWLVDGVRINNRLYGSTPPLDTLPAPMVQRVVLLEGPEALFYGTQAVAGAVNVITRDFSPTPEGQVAIGGDTHSTRHVDAYFSDTFAGQQFVLFGSDDHSQGFQPFRDQDFQLSSTRRHRAFDSGTVGLKYALQPTEDLRLSTTLLHTQGRLDDALPELVAVAYNQRNENVLSGKLDYTVAEQVQLFVKGYLHQWHSHYTEYDNDLDTPGKFDVIDDHDFWGYNDAGGTATVKLALNKGFEYYVGADYQAYSGSDAVLVITPKHERVQAYFGEVATTPDLVRRAQFAAGFRYNDPSFGPSATVWSVSGKIDLPAGMFARAVAGSAFRLPTAEELFANDPEDERGNPNLKPEKSTNSNFSIGATSSNAHLSWELIGFMRNIQDLISFDGFDPETAQAVAENVPGEVKVRGAELVLNAAVGGWLAASASYTYSHAWQNGNRQISRVPVQSAKAIFDFHALDDRVGATLSLSYVGRVYQSVWDGPERLGNYIIPDLAARWHVDSARHHLISARLQNLFNKQYATSIGTAVRDADGSPYTYWNLGVPRTFELRYTYRL